MTNFRHPEKVKNKENPIPKKPPWIRVKAPTSKFFKSTDKLLKDKKVITVCEEAACPNIAECWQKKHATSRIQRSCRRLFPTLIVLATNRQILPR